MCKMQAKCVLYPSQVHAGSSLHVVHILHYT